MTQFHEGQEVEVRTQTYISTEHLQWVRGTIIDTGILASLVIFETGWSQLFRNEAIKPIDGSIAPPSDYECADGNCN
jgi:hypothetical protein